MSSIIHTQDGHEVEVFTQASEGEEYTGIEIVNEKTGEWEAEIGCWFDNKRLDDYDGVYYLPSYAIAALRKAGWTVPRSFDNEAKECES